MAPASACASQFLRPSLCLTNGLSPSDSPVSPRFQSRKHSMPLIVKMVTSSLQVLTSAGPFESGLTPNVSDKSGHLATIWCESHL